MELVLDTLKIERIVGHTIAQALVEGEIAPPPGKPGMKDILDVRPRVTLGSVEALDGRLIMDGSISLFVLYAHDDGVAGFESIAGFKHTLDMEGTCATMHASAKPTLQTLDFELNDERRMTIRAVIDIACKVIDHSAVDTMTGIEGVDDLQALPIQIEVPEQQPLGSASMILRENVTIPQGMPHATEVLKASGSANVLSVRVEEGKAAIEGELRISTLYISESGLQEVAHTITFGQLVPLSQYPDGSVRATANVQELYAEPEDNGEGLALLCVEANIKFELSMHNSQELTVLQDAYSPSKAIACEKQVIEYRSAAHTVSGRGSIIETVHIPSGKPPATRALYANVRPVVTGVNMREGGTDIEGVAFARLVYMDANNVPQGICGEIPFSFPVELAAATLDTDTEVDISVDSVMVSGAGEALELRLTLLANVAAFNLSRTTVVTGAKETEAEMIKGGVVIYLCSAGETLWSIAKQFGTTRDEILKLNPGLKSATLEEGQRLLLYLRRAG